MAKLVKISACTVLSKGHCRCPVHCVCVHACSVHACVFPMIKAPLDRPVEYTTTKSIHTLGTQCGAPRLPPLYVYNMHTSCLCVYMHVCQPQCVSCHLWMSALDDHLTKPEIFFIILNYGVAGRRYSYSIIY